MQLLWLPAHIPYCVDTVHNTFIVHVRTHNIHIIDVLVGIDLYSFTYSPVYWELRSYLSKLLPTAGLGAVDDVIDNLKEVLTTRKQAQHVTAVHFVCQ